MPEDKPPEGTWRTLRRGLAMSPGLRTGLDLHARSVGRGGASGRAMLLSSSRVGATDCAATGLGSRIAGDANSKAGKRRRIRFEVPISAPLHPHRDSAGFERAPPRVNFRETKLNVSQLLTSYIGHRSLPRLGILRA